MKFARTKRNPLPGLAGRAAAACASARVASVLSSVRVAPAGRTSPALVSASAAAALAALALSACGERVDYTEAREYWAQPDTVVIGIGQPSDVKALSRDEVWVADVVSATILSLSPGKDRYLRIGMGDREPVQVQLPAKLDVAPDIGLAAFDAETRSVDLFTLEGQFIRGFTPGFIPAVMSFSREPLGFTFAVAAADSAGEGDTAGDAGVAGRRPAAADSAAADSAAADSAAADSAVARHAVVIRTDLQGRGRDTLLSPAHGPEVLRGAAAEPGETVMSPSATGIWVWSRRTPGTAYHLSPRETRRLTLQAPASSIGILVDRARDILWTVEADSALTTYTAYDARLATPIEGDEGGVDRAPQGVDGSDGADGLDGPDGDAAALAEDRRGTPPGAPAFLGRRTTGANFRPWVIHDGVVMGIRRSGGALVAAAYDLNVERFARVEAPN